MAKKTDEGQRYVKVSNIPVEWYNSEHIPFIQLHFGANVSPPLISQPVPKCRLTASPRGKPRGSCGSCYHSTNHSVPSGCGWLVAAPTVHTGSWFHSLRRSVPSGFGQRQSRRRVDIIVDPYSSYGKLAPFNGWLNPIGYRYASSLKRICRFFSMLCKKDVISFVL